MFHLFLFALHTEHFFETQTAWNEVQRDIKTAVCLGVAEQVGEAEIALVGRELRRRKMGKLFCFPDLRTQWCYYIVMYRLSGPQNHPSSKISINTHSKAQYK